MPQRALLSIIFFLHLFWLNLRLSSLSCLTFKSSTLNISLCIMCVDVYMATIPKKKICRAKMFGAVCNLSTLLFSAGRIHTRVNINRELYEFSVVKSYKEIFFHSFFLWSRPADSHCTNNIWRSVCFWFIQRDSLLFPTPFLTVIFAYKFLWIFFFFILNFQNDLYYVTNLLKSFQIYYIFVMFCVVVCTPTYLPTYCMKVRTDIPGYCGCYVNGNIFLEYFRLVELGIWSVVVHFWLCIYAWYTLLTLKRIILWYCNISAYARLSENYNLSLFYVNARYFINYILRAWLPTRTVFKCSLNDKCYS